MARLIGAPLIGEENRNSALEPDKPAREMAGAHRVRVGLTARLLLLIVGFVTLAEIAIYIPAIVDFRNAWIRDRLAAAYTAALAFEAAPTGVPDSLAREVLRSVGARTIVLQLRDSRRLIAATHMPPRIDDTYDLRNWSPLEGVVQSFRTLIGSRRRILRAIGDAPMGGEYVEITLDEGPLKDAMLDFSRHILLGSLLISLLLAALAAGALHLMVLRPVRRLTSNLISFGADPEDPSRIIRPSGSPHEIGAAEEALAAMQHELLRELHQKKRLAALGLAVAKINHDLRNMLAPAQLLSDRLADVSDPLARRLAPKLVATIDRAIVFCQSTLAYGRAAESPPKIRRFDLGALTADAAETVSPEGIGVIPIVNDVARGFEIQGDSDQMFRVFLNLLRNAVEALERAGPQPGRDALVKVSARRERDRVIVTVSDTGPGVPDLAKAHLFQAFQGSSRTGGTGLGLAIAADLVRAHGGAIRLEPCDETGATFVIELPDGDRSGKD